jgi:hypothetical protein
LRIVAQHDIVAPEIGEVLEHTLGIGLVEESSIHHGVAKEEATVAGEIDIDHLDVRIDPADIVLAGELAPDAPIAALVVNGLDPYSRPL